MGARGTGNSRTGTCTGTCTVTYPNNYAHHVIDSDYASRSITLESFPCEPMAPGSAGLSSGSAGNTPRNTPLQARSLISGRAVARAAPATVARASGFVFVVGPTNIRQRGIGLSVLGAEIGIQNSAAHNQVK